jgi:uncharacterized protein (DUF302 family)
LEKVEPYAFSTVLDTTYDDAVARTKAALSEHGFGGLTEIDIKATLKKKLDRDFRPYVILGACNPSYAYRYLQAELDAGLLLPCNVIVYQTDDQKAYVAAINPITALEVIANPELRRLAEEVSGKLEQAIKSLA